MKTQLYSDNPGIRRVLHLWTYTSRKNMLGLLLEELEEWSQSPTTHQWVTFVNVSLCSSKINLFDPFYCRLWKQLPKPKTEDFLMSYILTPLIKSIWKRSPLVIFSLLRYPSSISFKYMKKSFKKYHWFVRNPFFQGNVISTPATNGTILEGVTRKSIIEIAKDHGYQVSELI